MTALFDTHAHLQDPAFAGGVDDVLERAAVAGLCGITVCGYDAPSNVATLNLATSSPLVFPAVGFHPHDAKDVTPAMLAELESQAGLAAVVAVGEIGLDFYRDLSPRQAQRGVLDAQLAIALRVGKPVSVHSRAAEDAIFEQLQPFAGEWARESIAPPGVMHCFGGTLEQARRFVELGFLVSVACPVTYPKNVGTRRVASLLPLESLVVETDSPYLPPQPLRGHRNEPAQVAAAVEAIAALRGLQADAVAQATTENARRLFDVEAAVAAEVA